MSRICIFFIILPFLPWVPNSITFVYFQIDFLDLYTWLINMLSLLTIPPPPHTHTHTHTSLAPSRVTYCPTGWIKSHTSGTCIWLSQGIAKRTFNEARQYCKATYGGDLVKIMDDNMNRLIARKLI